MATKTVTPELKNRLSNFLSSKRGCDLVTAYLFFLSERFDLQPIAFPQGKVIFQSLEDAIKKLEDSHKLWRETEIRITFSEEAVNDETTKIYICPFSGKVFGNNTHPNPQDAIYDWVSNCPENQERAGGLKVKRFYVSEDPEVIKNYIVERKKPVTKKVYSSVITGKLFNSKAAVINDFKSKHVKPMTLLEVQAQSRFDLEESFLNFVQDQLTEERIAEWVQELAEHEEFLPYVQRWVESDEE